MPLNTLTSTDGPITRIWSLPVRRGDHAATRRAPHGAGWGPGRL